MSQLIYNLLLLTVCSLCAVANAKIINCYYNSIAYYRPGNGKFGPSDIDPDMCTHLSYAYFGIKDTGEFNVLDTQLSLDNGFIEDVMALKKINPMLKVLAVVGGQTEGSAKYSRMAADANRRKLFVDSTLKFLQEHNFDGLNLDWETPTQGGGSHLDKANLVDLLKELKEAFAPSNLELALGVHADTNIAAKAYDIPRISEIVDYINVMAFNYGVGSQGFLGLNSPLREQNRGNVETTVNYWLIGGAPASKLILGLPMFGHSFHLANFNNYNPGFPAEGPGMQGPYTKKRGFLSYNEICGFQPKWASVFSDTYGVPYMYQDKHWISYDNALSFDLKMDFVSSLGLGGVALCSIDSDDFQGECGQKYPLLSSVNKKLNKDLGETQLNPIPPTSIDCSKDGFYPNENNAQYFHQCSAGKRFDFVCGENTEFSSVTWTCVWPN